MCSDFYTFGNGVPFIIHGVFVFQALLYPEAIVLPNISAAPGSDKSLPCYDLRTVYEGVTGTNDLDSMFDERSGFLNTLFHFCVSSLFPLHLLLCVMELSLFSPLAAVDGPGATDPAYDKFSKRGLVRVPCPKGAPAPGETARATPAPAVTKRGGAGARKLLALASMSRRQDPKVDSVYGTALQPDSNAVLGYNSEAPTGLAVAVQVPAKRDEYGCVTSLGERYCATLGRCIHPAFDACPHNATSPEAESLRQRALIYKAKREKAGRQELAPPAPLNISRNESRMNRTLVVRPSLRKTEGPWVNDSQALRGAFYLSRALTSLMPDSEAAAEAHSVVKKHMAAAGVPAGRQPFSLLRWRAPGSKVSAPGENSTSEEEVPSSGPRTDRQEVEVELEELLKTLRAQMDANTEASLSAKASATTKVGMLCCFVIVLVGGWSTHHAYCLRVLFYAG
jgi:hypothetical protein